MRAISLGYHDVRDDPEQAVLEPAARYNVNTAEFRNHLQAIGGRTRNMSSVCVLDHFRSWGRELPVFITFDDGCLSAYTTVADELERHNCRGHFFVTTDWIGRPGFLDEAQILDLHLRGHIIGSHTCSHPERMSHLSWDTLTAEWTRSCSILSGILNGPVKVASVANGFYSPSVAKAAAASGIEILFTSEPTEKISVIDRCLVLGRYSVQKHTTAAVAGAIAGGARWPRWLQTASWQFKKPMKAAMGETYFAMRRFLLSDRCPQART